MFELKFRTSGRREAKNITRDVARVVQGKEGRLVHVFTLHTTCGLTINENADPDVMRDIMGALERLAPRNFSYKHAEGNSDAHIASSLAGHSLTIPFSDGELLLGTWQGIFLLEFDGPRERNIAVTIL